MERIRNRKSKYLREPLFSAPLGSPERNDPAFDEDLAEIIKAKPAYFPPYRYERDEIVKNIYRSNDEAYLALAKQLLRELEYCKNTYQAHQVLMNNLTPTQRKFFADAHMERMKNVTEIPHIHEAPITSLIREIDVEFGMVLLEYYASIDGSLLDTQIRSLNKLNQKHDVEVEEEAMRDEADSGNERNVIAETPCVSNVSKDETPFLNVKHDSNDLKQEDNDNSRVPVDEGKSEENDATKDEENHEENQDMSTLTANDSNLSGSTTKQASRSKLRQELLKEILQVTDLIRRESDEIQRSIYTKHLDNLRRRFNKNVEAYKSQEVASDAESARQLESRSYEYTDNVQLLHSQDRVHTDVSLLKYKDIPSDVVQSNSRAKSSMEDVDDKTWSEEESRIENEVEDVQVESSVNHESDKVQFIKIVAPFDMPEGYVFDAQYRQKRFLAKCPKGGVRKGEKFKSPVLNPSGATPQIVLYESMLDDMEKGIPRGRWRDGFFKCFHDPLCAMAFFCPQVALSQVRSRIFFFKTGRVLSSNGARFLFFFSLAVLSVNAWTIIALLFIVKQPNLLLNLICTIPLGLLDLFLIFSYVSHAIRARKEIMEHFDIPYQGDEIVSDERMNQGTNPSLKQKFVDACKAIFCSCCSISQMGRHTADYETYRERWFSSTGLSPQAENLVPRQIISNQIAQHESSHDRESRNDGVSIMSI